MLKNILIFGFIVLSNIAYAKGVFLEPQQFIAQTFNNNSPKPDKIWIKKEIKEDIKNILGHDIKVIRIRYWNDGKKTAWILEEIGRDKPITVGLVVKEQKIEQINVLVFRESRGWEVKYPFFTDQFKQSALIEDNQLDRKIDGISGATLSVNALTKLARLALYLDKQVNKK
ncbi:MAG: FMN-binding protein [Proteobacteria bacterium]|nr:FMN-binding protein [Pseudomonadota bacterium]NOG61494.1 FMN-binding protein [Pseudomonadota bacterium]